MHNRRMVHMHVESVMGFFTGRRGLAAMDDAHHHHQQQQQKQKPRVEMGELDGTVMNSEI